MELHSEELMYEFHAKDLSQPEALKQYADHAVRKSNLRMVGILTFRSILSPKLKTSIYFLFR